MRVLVTWGSKAGGTEGIARIIGDSLEEAGYDVDVLPPRQALGATGFDAVIVGGALYAGRWHRAARHFVNRRADDLARVPVWFFSSGPLDDSAERDYIPPTRQVESLMKRVGAQGHVTFGGRLEADAKGFPASAMAKEHAGDWRSPEQIRSWAMAVAEALPDAEPRPVIHEPAGTLERVLLHGLIGWASCASVMVSLLYITSTAAAVAVHAVLAPIIFVLVARHYFVPHGARDPLPTALSFTGIVAVLDAVVVAFTVQGSHALLLSFAGFWLPLALIFLATLATGAIMSTMPWPKTNQPVHGHGH